MNAFLDKFWQTSCEVKIAPPILHSLYWGHCFVSYFSFYMGQTHKLCKAWRDKERDWFLARNSVFTELRLMTNSRAQKSLRNSLIDTASYSNGCLTFTWEYSNIQACSQLQNVQVGKYSGSVCSSKVQLYRCRSKSDRSLVCGAVVASMRESDEQLWGWEGKPVSTWWHATSICNYRNC